MPATLYTAVLLALCAETSAHYGLRSPYGGTGGRSARPAYGGIGGHSYGLGSRTRSYGGMGGHSGGGGSGSVSHKYGWKPLLDKVMSYSGLGGFSWPTYGSSSSSSSSSSSRRESSGSSSPYGFSRRGQQLSAPIPDVPLADCAFPGCGACHPTEGAARSCTCPAGQFFGCNGCWPSHEEASSCDPCPAGRYLGCGRCWTTPEQADGC